jgi:hypothetical protein
MMSRMPSNPVRLSAVFYRMLLILYPPAHRREYGPLMVQAFRDLCWDEYQGSGLPGLMWLWVRTLADLMLSASAAHLEAAKEVAMAIKRTAVPMPWGEVMLAVMPGLLFGLSRVYPPIRWLFMGSLALVAVLAIVVLATQRHLPAWGLLALGLTASQILLMVGFEGMEMLARMGVGRGIRHWLAAIPLWAAILALAWKYKRSWLLPSWAWALVVFALSLFATLGHEALTMQGSKTLVAILSGADYSVLTATGIMLLPLVVGLPLSQRHGPLALLLILGVYSLWGFDSDFISGHLLRDMAFYPWYAFLLYGLFMSIAPLFLLRARSLRGQAFGLLMPVGIMLAARVVVPWLARPEFHRLRTWLGDMLLSVFTLLLFALALVLYTRPDRPERPANTAETNQPAYVR